VAFGLALLITTIPGNARLQRKARQLDVFEEFEDFDIPGSCPQGWIGHEGSCYIPFARGATWQEAEDTCRQLDSHLALSRSATENEFIAVEVGRPESRVWIGLRRIEGEFAWSDGKKADYTNWRRGEPKVASDCVSLLPEDIFQSWEVTNCDVMQAFICERENTTGLDITEDVEEATDLSTKATARTEHATATSPVVVLTDSPTDVGARFKDICSIGMHDCSTNGTCTPSEGSFECECNLGYEGDGRICADINECDNGYNDCHFNATCTNVPGSYYCQCDEGFHGNGKICQEGNITGSSTTTKTAHNGTDVLSTVHSLKTKEMEKPTYFVSTKAEVTGTAVAATTTEIPTPPPPSMPPIPPIPTTASSTSVSPEPPTAVVAVSKDKTGAPTKSSTPRSFTSSTGKTEIPTTSSADGVSREEHEVEKTTMRVSSRPTSSIRVFTEGGTSEIEAHLVNSCSSGKHNCSSNAKCLPAINGSYECRCNRGFEGDGKICFDIDECATNVTLCGSNAGCLNTDGSFTCYCKKVFIGNELTCRGIQTWLHNSVVRQAFCLELRAYQCGVTRLNIKLIFPGMTSVRRLPCFEIT